MRLKQQGDFDEDSLIYDVTNEYNSIVTSQMQINMAAKNLEVEKNNLDDAKFKQSLGIETLIDIESAELQIQKDQNDLNKSQNQLKDAEYKFKVVTGKDVTQYTLEQDIKFEQLKIDGSIDDYLDNVIDTYLNYSEQIVQRNKDYYADSNNSIPSSSKDNSIEYINDTTNIDNDKTAADTAQQQENSLPKPDTFTDFTEYNKEYEDVKSPDDIAINKYTADLASFNFINHKTNN